MTTYTKSTNFATKDALLTGNPAKVVKGTEIDAEFNAIQAADATSLKSGDSSTGLAFLQAGTGATSRTVQAKLRDVVSVKDFGAVGDGVTDDTAAIQLAFDYCSANNASLHIIDGSYVLSNKVTSVNAFDVTCDATASLRWTSSTDNTCGIYFDLSSAGDGMCNMNFPQLFSSAANSSFVIPGYDSGSSWNYNLSSRVGSAVRIVGGSRINLNIHYALGWTSACMLEATSSSSSDNINVFINTLDFCVNGLYLYTGPAGTRGFNAVVFNANTAWAKFPIYVGATYGYAVGCRLAITGSVFVNENGGCAVYALGTGLKASSIALNYVEAGEREDSVPATTSGLICPFIGGDQASNGTSYDGMGTSSNIGYFGGSHCQIDIGAAFAYVVTDLGSNSPIPVAGNTIRVRDAGQANVTHITYADYETSLTETAIASGTPIGEANFNGGVGGAQFAKSTLLTADITSLAVGASVSRFFYHQCLSGTGYKPITIAHKNETAIDNGIQIQAWQTTSVNREIRLRFSNWGSATFTGTLYFWVVLN